MVLLFASLRPVTSEQVHGDLPEHVRRNRAYRDEKAPNFVEAGEEGEKVHGSAYDPSSLKPRTMSD